MMSTSDPSTSTASPGADASAPTPATDPESGPSSPGPADQGLGLPSALSSPRSVGLGILFAVLVTYAIGIANGSFHFDDVHHLTQNPGIRSLANIPRFFVDATLWSGEPGNVMYRPVGLIPSALDYSLWGGYYAPGWLLTNALLHVTVALLVWRLALRLGLSPLASALAGLVMAVHPIHSEVVCYVSARSESSAAALFLTAVFCHLNGRSRSGLTRIAWFATALVVACLAAWCKETAALFFAAVALIEVFRERGPWRGRLLRGIGFGALYASALGLVLWVRAEQLAHAIAPVAIATPIEGRDIQIGGGRTVLENLLTQSRVAVLYAQSLLRPAALSVDHDVRIVTGIEGSVIAAVSIHAIVIGVAVRAALRGARLLPMCVGLFWVLLAPSIVIPLNVVMNEHRLYLPGIAVALVAGAALARVATAIAASGRSTTAYAAVAAPLLLFAALAADRSLEWRDDLALWSSAVERSPDSARARMHLGAAYHELSQEGGEDEQRSALLDLALIEYAESDRLHPGWYDLQLNIGGAYLARGRLRDDVADIERSLAAYEHAGEVVGAHNERPRYLRSIVLTELERYDEALTLIRELDAADESVTTLYPRAEANILRAMGDKSGAAAAMERVIEIETKDGGVEALLDLGWWYFEDGDFTASERYLSRAHEMGGAKPFKPKLYIARFLNLLGQPGADEFIRGARKLGWNGQDEELKWVNGGRTPGASTQVR